MTPFPHSGPDYDASPVPKLPGTDDRHVRHPLGTTVTRHRVLQSELRSTTWTELSSARLRFSEGGGRYLSF